MPRLWSGSASDEVVLPSSHTGGSKHREASLVLESVEETDLLHGSLEFREVGAFIEDCGDIAGGFEDAIDKANDDIEIFHRLGASYLHRFAIGTTMRTSIGTKRKEQTLDSKTQCPQ